MSDSWRNSGRGRGAGGGRGSGGRGRGAGGRGRGAGGEGGAGGGRGAGGRLQRVPVGAPSSPDVEAYASTLFGPVQGSMATWYDCLRGNPHIYNLFVEELPAGGAYVSFDRAPTFSWGRVGRAVRSELRPWKHRA